MAEDESGQSQAGALRQKADAQDREEAEEGAAEDRGTQEGRGRNTVQAVEAQEEEAGEAREKS